MNDKSYMTTVPFFGHAIITYSDKFLADLAARKTLTWAEARELAKSEFGHGETTRSTSGHVDTLGIYRAHVPYSKRIALGIVHKARALGVTYLKN